MKVLSNTLRTTFVATTATAALLASSGVGAQAYCGTTCSAIGRVTGNAVRANLGSCYSIPSPAGVAACVAAIEAAASAAAAQAEQSCLSSC